MNFCHLKTRTTFSLRKSTIKPSELVKTAKIQGATSLAITEIGNLFSVVKIVKACKEQAIKPIVGCSFQVQNKAGNVEDFSELTVLCKNFDGWKGLLKAVAKSNQKNNYNLKKELPTISLDDLAATANGNYIVYSGSHNSWLVSKLFHEQNVRADYKSYINTQIGLLHEHFGKENLRLEFQGIDDKTIEKAKTTGEIIRSYGNLFNIPIISTCRPHYLKKEGSENHKILICVDKKCTLNNIDIVLQDHFDHDITPFLLNNNSYLLNQEEYQALYPQKYLQNNSDTADAIETFDILGKPKLPNFICPDNIPPDEFLKNLCQESLLKIKLSDSERTYRDRLNYELEVLKEVGLSSYLLIVWDLVKFCGSNNWLASSRGSVGGSLVAFLLGISSCDPIKYGLIFERFYNAGRATGGGLCDVDMDLPSLHRDEVFQYIREKYGEEHTASIITFSGFKAAASIKEVARVCGGLDVTTANEITKLIVREDKISDELENLRLNNEDDSAIKWSIDNVKDLRKYVYYNDNGELCGEHANIFEKAMELEGCKRGTSRHACGIVISTEPLIDYCPLAFDKTTEKPMVALEKDDAEAVGCLKMDLLGVSMLDDAMETIRLMNEGDMI